MKKIIAFALILVLFSGCASTTPIEKQDNSTETTSASPAESTNTTSDVRIMETNWDVDIYNNSGFRQFILYLFSKEELDLSTIAVDIPTDFPYKFTCDEWSLGDAPIMLSKDNDADVLFSYDTYLHYCGFDWSELAKKRQAAQAARDNSHDPTLGDDSKNDSEAATQYQNYYLMHWDDYCKLDSSMLPQFHEYRIIISFAFEAPQKEERINQLSVTIGDQKIIHSIGEIRLHNEKVGSNSPELPGISYQMLSVHAPVRGKNGMQTIPAISFNADKDLFLNKIKVLTGNLDTPEYYLQISGKPSASANFIWDGTTPVKVSKGCSVSCDANIVDPRMKKTGFDFRFFVLMEYECDGVVYQDTNHFWICHDPNPYEEYAKLFDGIDFTEYYEKYYYPIVLGIES